MLVKCYQRETGDMTDFELDDSCFGVKEINRFAIAQVIRWQRHKRRAATACTKTRSEVKGSGRKIYKQKGTGNARHSARYAPQFRGGGRAHGPKGTKKYMTVPKKVRRLALRHSLSSIANSGNLFVVDDLEMDKISTKKALGDFFEFVGKKTIFIDEKSGNSNFTRSIKNIIEFNYVPVIGVNVYDIIRNDMIVVSKSALEKLTQRIK